MSRITQANAYSMNFTLSKREVVSQGTAKALIEYTRIPVVGRVDLEIGEEIKIDSEFLVSLVGNQLGRSASGHQ